MSRRNERGSLFVGRLPRDVRKRDLEDRFEKYGPVDRLDIKLGAEMAYAFVDFNDRLDAEDVIRNENGQEFFGCELVIEWAKGNPRRTMSRYGGGRGSSGDECFRCHRRGHWAKECRSRGPPPRWRRSRSRDRNRRRPRSYSRSRSRSRDRDRKRSRRDRDRKHSRSRSRSRSPRSRSASRSRSKSRGHTKSKSRDRSRSKSRGHSRSKSRGRSPSKSRSRSLTPKKEKNHRSPDTSAKGGNRSGSDKDD